MNNIEKIRLLQENVQHTHKFNEVSLREFNEIMQYDEVNCYVIDKNEIIAIKCCNMISSEKALEIIFTIDTLIHLNLKGNSLVEIPKEIVNLVNLQTLNLNFNALGELPKEIENLTKLYELNLSSNRFVELPKEIRYLTNLQTLHLNSNRLKTLPKEIENLTNLQNLSLNFNALGKLPKEIGYLTNLKFLNVSFNGFRKLSKEIKNLTKLEILDLGFNYLEELPKEIGKLTNLHTLHLRSNSLEELPKEIGDLTNLQTFYVRYNKLKKLPKEIGKLTNLLKFDLKSNKLTGLPEEIVNLTKLEELDLSSNQLTRLPKEIGDLTKLEELDLSSNQLTGLPKEIANLVNLINLDLSANQLTELPKEIANLMNLQELNLKSNQLTELPKEIVNLINLETLKLGINRFTELQKEIANLTNLQNLDLGVNRFTKLPKEIENLTNLIELNLSANQLTKLPKEIENLTNIQNLDLSYNNFTELPKEIENLTNLQILNLNQNGLTELPKEIEKFVNLVNLNLDFNSLTELPKEIKNLTNLKELNVNSNELTKLPKEIENLTNLHTLDISSNELTKLPKEIENLTNLQTLNLKSNQLTELPKEIKNLSKIQALDISSNQLTELPKEIKNLSRLRNFDISSNQLTELPKEIKNLSKLRNFDISSNQLTKLPKEIRHLTILQTLGLKSNQLTELPEEIGNLLNLYELNLNSNLLTRLPKEIEKLVNLKQFFITNNNIQILDEAYSFQGYELVKYILEVQKHGKSLNEAKVLIVGDERVGKTSIVNAIVGRNHEINQNSTEGIDIIHHTLDNNVRINIWDFAGQEITHQTHQFFLSERSLYVLVLDVQKEDNDPSIYNWLQTIKIHSNNSPIIVVINKVDKKCELEEIPDYDNSRVFEKNRYKDEFNIVDVIYISAEKRFKTNELLKILEVQIKKLHNINAMLPKKWFDIKEEIQKIAEEDKQDFIELLQYENICEKHGINKENEQKSILKILNEIGTIVSYCDDQNLNIRQILNPMWVTNGIYKIIRSPYINQNNGKFSLDDFSKIFAKDNRYNRERHYQWILNLLKKFELAFSRSNESEVFIPSCFSSSRPNSIYEYNGGLNFHYFYLDILKKSIIAQFIVNAHQYIDYSQTPSYWNRGVLLKYGDCKAIVILEENTKKVSISINTKDAEGRTFLNILRHIFSDIHNKKIRVKERVPLIDKKTQNIINYVNYEFLVSLEKKNIKEYNFEIETGGVYECNISELLDGYRYFDIYENITQDLFEVIAHETENRHSIFHESEDEINDRIKTGLLNKKYNACDQSRGGESKSGKSAGERDLVIRDKETNNAITIIEALIITTWQKDNIIEHYERICDKYDTLGNKRNFCLVYAKNKDFEDIWERYSKLLNIKELQSDTSNIKKGLSYYKSNTEIYHFFINFYSK